jgi:hypothetical protein
MMVNNYIQQRCSTLRRTQLGQSNVKQAAHSSLGVHLELCGQPKSLWDNKLHCIFLHVRIFSDSDTIVKKKISRILHTGLVQHGRKCQAERRDRKPDIEQCFPIYSPRVTCGPKRHASDSHWTQTAFRELLVPNQHSVCYDVFIKLFHCPKFLTYKCWK